jgi:hypothetical protein
MGTAHCSPCDRRQIYKQWHEMEGDPIVSIALGLLTTAALGGKLLQGEGAAPMHAAV